MTTDDAEEEDEPLWMLSSHEMRRRAPGHYAAKGYNAWFGAYVLWHLSDDTLEKAAEDRYGGNPRIAIGEAYRREASLALELILKAVIACKIQRRTAPAHVKRVPQTHEVLRLWRDAALPTPSPDDATRLFDAGRTLIWTGKYGAPRTDEAGMKEHEEAERLRRVQQKSQKMAGSRGWWHTPLDWDSFDRLFHVASAELERLDGGQ